VTIVDRPARGTRPANRRELIIAAASGLFASRGYEHVSVSDIAEAVGVRPSALYRHFAGKEQLLTEVVADVVGKSIALLDSLPEPGQVIPAAAAFALDHRTVGALLEHEARHLPPQPGGAAHAGIRQARDRFTTAIAALQPAQPPANARLLASAAMAVLVSPSLHHVDVPRPGYDALLAELAGRALAAELPRPPAAVAAARPVTLTRASRREQLLTAAITLFAERTYASVSMEDVAVSIGMAASSVYNHFPGKLDMLVTALNRGNGYLQIELDETLTQARDPMEALRGLIGSYSRFALAHPHLVDVLITEVRNLPPDSAATLLRAQRDYINEWVHLLRRGRAGLDPASARVTIQAALTLINDLARNPGLRSRPDAREILTTLGRAVLAV
jgi:AcrR family transcriptional regulator